jgi:hypothetical protein
MGSRIITPRLIKNNMQSLLMLQTILNGAASIKGAPAQSTNLAISHRQLAQAWAPILLSFSAYTFFHLARKADHHGFMHTPKDNKKYFCASTTNAVTTDNYNTFIKGKPTYSREELLAKVPQKYHSKIEVFIKSIADKLPPHRTKDHKIQLMGTTTPFAQNYRPMSAQELEAVKKHLEEHLGKGFISRLSLRKTVIWLDSIPTLPKTIRTVNSQNHIQKLNNSLPALSSCSRC